MTDYADKLRKSGAAYQRARNRAEQIMAGPREQLTNDVREAYKAGIRKADIIRMMGGVWSRQWIDNTVRDIQPPGGRITRRRTSTKGE